MIQWMKQKKFWYWFFKFGRESNENNMSKTKITYEGLDFSKTFSYISVFTAKLMEN